MFPETFSKLIFFVNGKKVIEDDPDPEWTLLFYLRRKLNLCGTKLGCGEGGCGACTIMISRFDRKKNKILHLAVNACLFPVCAAHGLSITTIECIGSTSSVREDGRKPYVHPVQESIALAHGLQCGFCTPGIVMSMYTLLRSSPGAPSMEDIEESLHGNLCRCTGYRSILEGFRSFTQQNVKSAKIPNSSNNGSEKDTRESLANGNGLIKLEGKQYKNYDSIKLECSLGKDCCKYQTEDCGTLFDASKFTPYDPKQEPIFPPELHLSSALDEQYLVFKGKRSTWYRPLKLEELLSLKHKYPYARIVVGNTEVGVEMKFKHCVYPILIHPNQIKELLSISQTSSEIKVGAAVTLTEMEAFLKDTIKTLPAYKTRIISAIVEMLQWFAGKQIRNVAGIGGNIMTGSPISDLNPIFMAAGCRLEILSQERGPYTLLMDEKFFTGYRKNVLKADELLLSIDIPFTDEDQYFFTYKQSKRKVDDIAIVNAAMSVVFVTGTKRIMNLALAFGGMAPITVMAIDTAKKLKGREWNSTLLEDAFTYLMDELPLSPDAPGGVVQYRKSLTLSFFFRFFLKVSQLLPCPETISEVVLTSYRSGADTIKTIPLQSSQYVKMRNGSTQDVVGRPKVQMSAIQQATGEAVYCDDIPYMENEAYMALVKSTNSHAKIISIETKDALMRKGVIGIYTAKDIDPVRNCFGTIVKDEEIFASTKVVCNGQIIAVVIAEDQFIAQEAARLVKIEYEDLHPKIITIEDAIKERSFFHDFTHLLKKGDTDQGFQKSEHIISGEVRTGGQEHFYLETMSVIVIPKGEDSELTIYCTTQNLSEMQATVSHFLGIPQNRVVCKVKRMGGAFGGKESRSCLIALPAALAASKLKRPIRCMLDRDEDMVMTGTRHSYLGRYKAGFNKDGKIIAIEVEMYINGGNSLELSFAVLMKSLFHLDNAYHIPNFKCSAYICKTNLPSNTGFRGFGAPQSMFLAENVIRHIASYLKKDTIDVASINFYKTGDMTHYNQTLDHCTIQKCWKKCLEESNYFNRKKEIEEYNRKNRWKKRGISVVPTKLGIGFAEKFLNQAGALILVYTDGSVLLTHGGVEMGQGLHTKMIQVASRALGISDSLIHINETSTDKVPNTSATAASSSSDLNGMAILDACQKISERIAPYKKLYPNSSWKDWIHAAYMDRVSLSATGFYRTPDVNYDPQTNSGMLYNYYTFGAACSEVEIDCLTGDHQVIQTDIVMDIGESINPAIDVGQIEGGFLQGMGLFTLEELQYSVDGMLLTKGPGTYKIPANTNAPRKFNVYILEGVTNPRAVYSSKAVGEPPLFLSASVFFALKEAIISARSDANIDKFQHFRMDSPATAAEIRMLCSDSITEKLKLPESGHFKPWNIKP